MRWTEEDLQRFNARAKDPLQETIKAHGFAPKESKFRNHRVVVDGEKYDSKREYHRCCQLRLLERAGKISNLRRQVPFVLAPSVIIQGKKKRELTYIADFTYTEDGRDIVEDSKGCRTDVYVIKRHLLMSVHNIEIRET